MNLPEDPVILLSVVNTLLRDRYPSLAALCDDCGIEENLLAFKLGSIGYHYDEKNNSFN